MELGCFYFLAIMNNASMDICVQTFVWTYVSIYLGNIPNSGISGSYGNCMDHNKLWKILKEMEIPDHLTCLLRNLYAGQEATVRKQTWNNGLVHSWEKSMTRLCIVTLLI